MSAGQEHEYLPGDWLSEMPMNAGLRASRELGPAILPANKDAGRMSSMQAELRRALVVFRENPSASNEELLKALCAVDIERTLAIAIIQFMSSAFMRAQFRDGGPILSGSYMRFLGNRS